jgi:hypothetical protein
MHRNPGYNQSMNAKSRYRLQGKLQSALTRVIEALMRMQDAGVELNFQNFVLAAGVVDFLQAKLAPELKEGLQSIDNCHPMIVETVLKVVRRRRQETKARRKRQKRQGTLINDFGGIR